MSAYTRMSEGLFDIRPALSEWLSRMISLIPEEGFDPGPDEEDYIPWDADRPE